MCLSLSSNIATSLRLPHFSIRLAAYNTGKLFLAARLHFPPKLALGPPGLVPCSQVWWWRLRAAIVAINGRVCAKAVEAAGFPRGLSGLLWSERGRAEVVAAGGGVQFFLDSAAFSGLPHAW